MDYLFKTPFEPSIIENVKRDSRALCYWVSCKDIQEQLGDCETVENIVRKPVH